MIMPFNISTLMFQEQNTFQVFFPFKCNIYFINSESLDFPCYCAAQLTELTEYFFTKICAVMGEGGHLG